MKRVKIVDLVKDPKYIDQEVNVKGWVRTKRGSKYVAFIAMNDGSSVYNLQIVADKSKIDEELLKKITTGACLSVDGKLVESQGKGQTVEVQADAIEIYGTADPDTYPLQKKEHTFESVSYTHLTLPTN